MDSRRRGDDSDGRPTGTAARGPELPLAQAVLGEVGRWPDLRPAAGRPDPHCVSWKVPSHESEFKLTREPEVSHGTFRSRFDDNLNLKLKLRLSFKFLPVAASNRQAKSPVGLQICQPRPAEPAGLQSAAGLSESLNLGRPSFDANHASGLDEALRACGLRRTEEYPGRILINLQIRKKITFEIYLRVAGRIARCLSVAKNGP
jgi:hypothetical protein